MEYKLQLKEEQLDVVKNFVKRGNVKITCDTYTRYISLNLPVEYTDLFIKREEKGNEEIIRIPLSQETYEHTKKTEILNDIEVYRNYFQDMQHVEIDLKKEKLAVERKDEQQ